MKLKFLLGREHCVAVELLDELPPDKFSTERLLEGCAHALRLADLTTSGQQDRENRAIRDTRNKVVWKKNNERNEGVAREMIVAALKSNPNFSLGAPALLGQLGQGDAGSVARKVQQKIQSSYYGCVYYPNRDLLRNHPPTPEALLAFNLEWLFRHWPVDVHTYPTRIPNKQGRSLVSPVKKGLPRRKIIAEFVSSILKLKSGGAVISREIKDRYRFPSDAKFVGWE